MEHKRIVGIDLGIATAHTVVATDETAKVLTRRRCSPTVESLAKVEQAAMDGFDGHLDVVMEPTGAAWLPVAVFFINRGHNVYRVSSAKAFDLRRFLSRHAKSNSIDALTLAKLAIVDSEHLVPLVLSNANQASLDRRVRAVDRLGEKIAEHKIRIRELVRQVMPMVDSAVAYKLSYADLAVLEVGADPRELVKLDAQELGNHVRRVSNGNKGVEHIEAWQRVAREALELYGDSPAVAFSDIADEIKSEIRILLVARDEQKKHIAEREKVYELADPDGLARSLPGIALNGGPVIVSTMANPQRFPNAASFKSFTGLSPKGSETGNTDRKGQPMSKAGPRRLRDQLVLSAQAARKLDPQLAEIYFRQMTERGAHHTKANCVVAARLAERAWVVMRRGEPYVIRDRDGNAVTPERAKEIIAEQFTVSEEVRRRTRSRKSKGKAPHQVLEGRER